MVLTYYTLATPPEGLPEYRYWQLETGLKTFRAHNPGRPAWLFVYDAVHDCVRDICHDHAIELKAMGPYEDALRHVHPGWWALRRHPVLQRWLALCHIPDEVERVLHLDNDTIFFDSLDDLLSCHQQARVYARKEASSRHHPKASDPLLIDEDRLAALAQRLGGRFVPPFNTGVVLFNHGSWRAVRDQVERVIDLTWLCFLRFALSNESYKGICQQVVGPIRERLTTMSAAERQRALPDYPTANVWIVEEVAMWLLLGELGLSCDQLRPDLVLQAREFERHEPDTADFTLIHYFSTNTEAVSRWLRRQPQADAIMGA